MCGIKKRFLKKPLRYPVYFLFLFACKISKWTSLQVWMNFHGTYWKLFFRGGCPPAKCFRKIFRTVFFFNCRLWIWNGICLLQFIELLLFFPFGNSRFHRENPELWGVTIFYQSLIRCICPIGESSFIRPPPIQDSPDYRNFCWMQEQLSGSGTSRDVVCRILRRKKPILRFCERFLDATGKFLPNAKKTRDISQSKFDAISSGNNAPVRTRKLHWSWFFICLFWKGIAKPFRTLGDLANCDFRRTSILRKPLFMRERIE